MTKKIITGQDLERWRYDHGFVVGTAAECFGIQTAKWEGLVRKDEVITDARILNLYHIYTMFPDTIPVPESFDYVGLFNELGLSNDTRDKKEFARLFGISVTGTYRILEKNAAGRDIEAYAHALKRTGVSGTKLHSLMRSISRMSENVIDAGQEVLKTKAAQKKSQTE
ncbi:hypothetical protein IFU23_24485 [Pantoea agglomerans]|uniref:Uncharacterized protein n=1 Tax=Enterobacter agglomerans TaxID=549 RepID=A0ACC5PW87_ENTAG|nr:hypothetical protein [Pantoea agglomerans]MBD8129391.1 hypothetical protein [Pantoea agglomerans]MBD8156483.1 hypothetical protein [Pantoea agglomerans]MBD8161234.1 hypothetical protein [Pantoea agglomerans]MBD8234900.1 hypothetical protein [Pantoea agglomerans]MBD8245297.1 hypothetical protein [Pantoea agglomerans]